MDSRGVHGSGVIFLVSVAGAGYIGSSEEAKLLYELVSPTLAQSVV